MGSHFRSNHYDYVDNLDVLGFDEATITEGPAAAVEVFDARCLQWHEGSVGTGERNRVDTAISGVDLSSRITAKRVWHLQLAISEVLRRRSRSGASLEISAGHMTFAGPASR